MSSNLAFLADRRDRAKPESAQVVDVRLSKMQRAVLDCVKEGIDKQGFPPSIREIGLKIGRTSSSTVWTHIQNLKKKGHLEGDRSQPRSIRLVQRVDLREVRILLGQWVEEYPCSGLAEQTHKLLQQMVGA